MKNSNQHYPLVPDSAPLSIFKSFLSYVKQTFFNRYRRLQINCFNLKNFNLTCYSQACIQISDRF